LHNKYLLSSPAWSSLWRCEGWIRLPFKVDGVFIGWNFLGKNVIGE